MTYRNGNYSAFYVAEPFDEGNLGANKTKDFLYYNMLCMWKGEDSQFPFNDSHSKNYNVRDGSGWETTLKPRLRERLRGSKNIVLFLSSTTEDSRALHEELDYGINILGLPVIVVYPGFGASDSLVTPNGHFKDSVVALWDKLPVFRDCRSSVACAHVLLDKGAITLALSDAGFTVQRMKPAGDYLVR